MGLAVESCSFVIGCVFCCCHLLVFPWLQSIRKWYQFLVFLLVVVRWSLGLLSPGQTGGLGYCGVLVSGDKMVQCCLWRWG